MVFVSSQMEIISGEVASMELVSMELVSKVTLGQRERDKEPPEAAKLLSSAFQGAEYCAMCKSKVGVRVGREFYGRTSLIQRLNVSFGLASLGRLSR